jgi:molybdate transport system substrate-binding protein
MNRPSMFAIVAFALLFPGALPPMGGAGAAEIKVMSAVAMSAPLNELTVEFERSTGHKLVLSFGTVGAVQNRIQAGETADVAILTPSLIEDLAKQDKIAAGSRVDIAKVGVGLVIRAGASKPDISSVEAFKRTLINAKSISHGDPAGGGASSIHIAQVLDRLGIAGDMKPKTKLGAAAAVVASGEADIGMSQLSEITGVPGTEVVGPLPPELQSITAFSGAVFVGAKEAEASKALLRFLTSPAATSVLKAKGMEPG